MNRQSLIRCAGAVLVAAAFSSCGASRVNPGPIVTTPPAKSVSASSEFSIGDGIMMKKFIYPAGVYTPVHEDSKAHYYAPPGEQIRVKDTGMDLGTQGGIYWEKGLDSPKKVYFTGNFGIKAAWDKPGMPITIKK
jgi:hypothetical protein